MDLGTWADWAAALAGFLAFGAVIWQQLVETKHRKADIARERANREEEQAKQQAREDRVQAEAVAAWIFRGQRSGSLRFVPSGNPVVYVQNHSRLPVYNVVISLVPIKGAAPRKSEDIAPINRNYRLFLAMPPGKYGCGFDFAPGGMGLEYAVEIAFEDTQGKTWVRRVGGKLEDLHGADPRAGRIEDFSQKSSTFEEISDS